MLPGEVQYRGHAFDPYKHDYNFGDNFFHNHIAVHLLLIAILYIMNSFVRILSTFRNFIPGLYIILFKMKGSYFT